MNATRLTLAALLALSVPARAQNPAASGRADTVRIQDDIRYLASDALDGRLTGYPGNDTAAAYLARRFQALGLKPGGDDGTWLQHWTVGSTAATREAAVAGRGTENVVAILPGRGSRAGQDVVIGAHFDHLGNGPFASAATGDSAHLIHHGADDNASGTAAVLEIARLLARSRERPERTIVFVLFSGEEEGALGSAWYADHPVIPVDSTLAMINLDMVGRLRDHRLLIQGVKSATEWQPLIDSVNATYGLDVHASGDGWGPSDQSSFFAKHLPVLFLFTDLHADYHRPSDTWEKINESGVATVAAFAADLARRLAGRPRPLTFVDAPLPQMASGERAYLGTVPDMTGEPGGVRLSGVRAGSPADLAGIRAGDVIVGIGADTVADLNDFQNALVKHHPGETVEIRVRRGDQTLALAATLGRRS
ncbi:MAG TPA: M20/M25/M40 family metallo-hydrolase [Gemmatimonadales bacterium]|nr:M20/M25/M40 family metallo-hydrolase [Gemmatimonadales bacterium]